MGKGDAGVEGGAGEETTGQGTVDIAGTVSMYCS